LNAIFSVKNNELARMFSLNLKGRLLEVHNPMVMGILNVTPDSFYEGSRVMDPKAILARAEQMIEEGADILDIGGQSTRPGSTMLGALEEAERVVPAIEAIKKQYPGVIISVDTFHAAVARLAVNAGAEMINDISAGSLDAAMLGTVAALHVPYVMMHMRGNPSTMTSLNQYSNVVQEVWDFLALKIGECHQAGITDVIADPGFGFAKAAEQNFQLLSKFEDFDWLEVPMLAGLSRKSTIYKTLGVTAEESLNGTTVCNTVAVQKFAAILRVHDVKAAREMLKLLGKL
jgi:dihydropteroate synthase